MTKTVFVTEFDEREFNNKINEALETIEKMKNVVIDIKFNSFSGRYIEENETNDYIGYSALIVYMDNQKIH